MSLLTGRQLVDELGRLGLGTWTPDAVRQWIREEPPCPIAEAADQGKPHRYQLLDVLTWLQARADRDRSKGFASQASTQLIDRIAVVLRQFVTGQPAATNPPAEPSWQPLTPIQPDLLAPAKSGRFTALDIEESSDIQLVMEVLKGRDAQSWKQVEDALSARRKRLEADGQLVPVEDLQATLDTQAMAMRNASNAMVIALAQRIPDASSFEQRRAIIQTAVDRMLEGLSRGEGDEVTA